MILTGEALRRENAEGIAKILSEQGGEFVCATAGHHMESMLAAYGSGASRVSHDEDKRILNIDIGGGTTKLGVVEKGHVIATAAVHIGGRLQVVDRKTGHIERLDPAGRYHARQAGFDWHKGDIIDPERPRQGRRDHGGRTGRRAHASGRCRMRSSISTSPTRSSISAASTASCSPAASANTSMAAKTRDFGDMGRRLGTRSARKVDAGALPWPLLPAGECIRATALGASEYSVQLSGNTSYISKPGELLPRRNLQVLQPPFDCERGHRCRRRWPRRSAAISPSFDLIEGEGEVALALRWQGVPSYERIAAFAEGIRHGLQEHDRAQEADLHHARRRHRPDARRDPARGAAGRERDLWPSTA